MAIRLFDASPTTLRRAFKKRSAGEPRATDGCSDMLREAIVSGELPHGIRLPAERRLAERFGVNRVTIRAALQRLEAEHLITVRQGSGYVVGDYRRVGTLDLVTTLAAQARDSATRTTILRDLLMVRRQLARAVLERLMEHASERGLLEVEAAIERFAAIAERRAKVEDLARADLDVVAALVAATESEVLQLCLNPVAALALRLPRLCEAMYREPKSNVLAFRAVLDLLRKGNRASIEAAIDLLSERDEATLRFLERKGK